MRMLQLIVVTALLSGAQPALSVEIFRWIDANGIVHLSDTRPNDVAAVTSVEIDLPTSGADDSADDPYSVMNQAKRIHERWLEIVAATRRPRSAAETVGVTEASQPQDRDRTYYLPVTAAGVPPRYPSHLARDQARALAELDLLGPRPASINSSAHRERVLRSRALPLVVGRDLPNR